MSSRVYIYTTFDSFRNATCQKSEFFTFRVIFALFRTMSQNLLWAIVFLVIFGARAGKIRKIHDFSGKLAPESLGQSRVYIYTTFDGFRGCFSSKSWLFCDFCEIGPQKS